LSDPSVQLSFFLVGVPIVFLIFVALVPLFLGEHFLCTQRVSKYLLGFSSITIFHLIAGFRIFADVDVAKILMILLVNAVILSIPWAIYTQIKRAYSLHFSLLALVVSWIALEYLTTHINLMIPWFDLGNSLGGYPELIQWYDNLFWLSCQNPFRDDISDSRSFLVHLNSQTSNEEKPLRHQQVPFRLIIKSAV
jgi:hypothetical protein